MTKMLLLAANGPDWSHGWRMTGPKGEWANKQGEHVCYKELTMLVNPMQVNIYTNHGVHRM